MRMGQARSVIVTHVAGENLHLAREPAECGTMQNPIAIALEWTSIRMLVLGMLATLGITGMHGVAGKQHALALVPVGFRIARVGLLHRFKCYLSDGLACPLYMTVRLSRWIIS